VGESILARRARERWQQERLEQAAAQAADMLAAERAVSVAGVSAERQPADDGQPAPGGGRESLLPMVV